MSEIKEIRELTGLSLKQVADWLGVSRGMIFMIEKGKRRLSTEAIFKLSAMLLQLKQLKQVAQTGRVEFSDPLKLAELHREKMEKHRGLAARLQRQLDKLQRSIPKLQSRQALFDVLKGLDIPGYSRNAGDKMVIELMELESKKPESLLAELELLQDKIDTHLAYAELHKKRWEEFAAMDTNLK